MPKFSAYMRGEEGPQGDVGQAALIDGIVDAFKDGCWSVASSRVLSNILPCKSIQLFKKNAEF